jgi:hypothetical protein
MSFFNQLREQDASSAVAFHLEGVLDASDNIRAHLAKLDQNFGQAPDVAADTLVDLQVELYTHLVHHLKELRKPLEVLVSGEYGKLPDLDPEDLSVLEVPKPSPEG